VRLAVDSLKGASVIPQAAVIQSPRGKIVYVVYVVDAAARVAPRPVEVVYASGEDAAVKGLRPGERIVLEGRQNLRPGASVIDRPAGEGGAGKGRRGAASAASGVGPGPAAGASSAGRSSAAASMAPTPAV
jgi:hypothetical protein